MSCMKEGNGPCEYKCGSFMKGNNIYIHCSKHNNTVDCSYCDSCNDYREEYNDYDWKDHWC